MKDNNIEIPSSKFGAGANPKMRRIAAYRKASGDKTITLVHNKKRAIYIHEAVSPDKRQEIIQSWFDRWGYPRYLKKKDENPPYINGLSSSEKVVEIEKTYINVPVKLNTEDLTRFFENA